MRKTARGITIVSLVVTIILLLILSTVSIQGITKTGLFEKANMAKLENKRGQITEWLNLKLYETQSENYNKTAKEIIELTRQNVEKDKSQLEKMGKNVNIDSEISTEEDGEQVGPYFYVIVDKDIYKVSMEEQKFIGEDGKLLPVIKLISISNTSNSITVKVRTSRNEGGKLKYYIKEYDASDYTLVKELEDETYTYEGLKQGVKYSVKIVAENTNKLTSEVVGEQTTGTVIDLKEGDLEFTSEPSTWTNTNVKVTVKANVDTKGYKLQTSKDGKKWDNTTTQICSTNGYVYARLWDGTNYGGTATGNVENIDKTKPQVGSATATTNSITINATDEASGIIGYALTTTNTEPTEFTVVSNRESLEVTVEKQKQETTYYVWVKDQAGNISEGKTVTTGTVTDLTAANVKFTYSPSGWTNKDVTATASTTVTGFTIQTSKDGSNWSSTATQTYSSNGKIYARLWDGTNYGATATGNFTNIDKTKPVVTGATATTNKIAITATDEASGIIGYAVTTSNTEPSSFTDVASTKTLSVEPTGYKQGTTYYVWVKDQAGNVSASKSTATGKVTDLTAANVKFTYSPSGWTNKDVTATASTTVTGFTIQTSKDGSNWSSTATQTYSSNGKIYARLWDGTNFGATATGNFTNIDKTKPVVTGATATTNKIAITATDEASGIIGYAVTTSNTAPSSFTGVTNTKSLSVAPTGYKQGTTYYVWVKDQAGNVSASKSTATGKVTDLTAANVKFTYNPSGWTNKDVTATASTTVTGYTLQTSKDGKIWESKATQTYSSNGTIYARLWDGTNYGATATGNFTNIDKTKPVVTGATATTNKIAITATDEASGIIGYAVTTSNTAPSSFTGVTNTKSLSVAPTGYKQGTTYYVWVKDQAGNVSASKSTATGKVTDLTAANVKFTYNPSGWTNKDVTATASTTVTGFTIQTSKDGSNWSSTATQTYSSNGKIYARLWDGTNFGATATGNFTNIDKTKPVVTGATATTNKIAITATDEASGIIGYAVTTSNTAPSSFTGVKNTKSLSVAPTGYKQGTTYYVWVKDQAGNVSASKSTATGKVTDLTAANVKFTYSPSGWTNKDVTATASTTVTGFTIQTSTNGQDWANVATRTYSNNGQIYARLTDGTNYGGVATGSITNIDKTAPTYSYVEIKNVNIRGYDVYVYGVTDAGSGVNRIQFPTWTDTNGQDDIQQNWEVNQKATGVRQADGTTWVYHVDIGSHNNETGAYTTHIYIYDNLENYVAMGYTAKVPTAIYGTEIQNSYGTLYTTDYPTGNIPQSAMDKYNAGNYDRGYYLLTQTPSELISQNTSGKGYAYVYSGDNKYNFTEQVSNRWIGIHFHGTEWTTAMNISNVKIYFSDNTSYTIREAVNQGYIEPLVICESMHAYAEYTIWTNILNILDGNATSTNNYPDGLLMFKVKERANITAISFYTNKDWSTSYADGLRVYKYYDGFEIFTQPIS